MRDAKGFTLVELLIAVGVAMGLLVAVYMAVNSTQRHSTSIERKVTAQQDLKPALDIMALEIGMASYNPTAATSLWVNPANCSAAANPNYRGIQVATANSIVVEMDITNAPNSSGVCTATDGNGLLGDCSEIISYEYLSGTTDLRITRETIRCSSSGTRTTGGAQSLLGATAASGVPRTVRVINNTAGAGNTAIPVFRYYDGTGAEIASTGLPAGIPNIRRIDITLAVETEDVNVNTGERITLTYSTSVIPRNHAIQ
jgi:Tfp pilus assembly protein PilE